jgi:hypothetical protein
MSHLINDKAVKESLRFQLSKEFYDIIAEG